MRYASVTDRLSGLAGAKWALHARARAMQAAGAQIIVIAVVAHAELLFAAQC